MADNLSVAITADVSSLQTQLALAQAEVRAYAAEVRSLASQARSAGDDVKGGLIGQLDASTRSLAGAKAEAAALTSEIKRSGDAHKEHAGHAREHGEALVLLGERAREVAAIFGIGFGIEKIAEGIQRTTEWGERTENMAAALGVIPEEYAKLQGAFQLVGGDIDTAGRMIQIFERNARNVLDNPNSGSKQADAFHNLGISAEDLGRTLQNPLAIFDLLADRVQRFVVNGSEPGRALADLKDIMGRAGLDTLIAGLKEGEAGLQKLKQRWMELTGVNEESIKNLAETQKSINEMKAAFWGLEAAIVTGFKEPIVKATTALTEFVREGRDLISFINEIIELRGTVAGAGAGAAIGGLIGGPLGAFLGGAGGAAVGFGQDVQRQNAAAQAAAEKAVPLTADVEEFERRKREINNSRLDEGWPVMTPEEERTLRNSMRVAAVPPGAATFRGSTGGSAAAVDDLLRMENKRPSDAELKSYITDGGVGMDPAKAAWCAMIVNAALGHHGVTGSGSQVANSFLKWGEAVRPEDVRKGDVVDIPHGHGADEVGGHVALATGNVRRGPGGALQVEVIGRSGVGEDEIRRRWRDASEGLNIRRASEAEPTRISVTSGVGEKTGEAPGHRDSTAAKRVHEEELKRIEDEEKRLKLYYETEIEGAAGVRDKIKTIRAQEDADMIRLAQAKDAANKKYTDATGIPTTGSADLKVMEVHKQQVKDQVKEAEETRAAAIAAQETQRKILDRQEATALSGVESRRRMGQLTTDQAAAEEEQIVTDHAKKVDRILAEEARLAEGSIKLTQDVKNRKDELGAQEEAQLTRIRQKRAEEEYQRGHAIDKEIAGSLSSGIVDAAWHKGSPQQAMQNFIQAQEKKALDAVGTKLLDSFGVGKLLDSIGSKALDLIPGAGKAATETAAAATFAATVTGAGATFAATVTGAGALSAGTNAAAGGTLAAAKVAGAAEGAASGGGSFLSGIPIIGGLFGLLGLEGGGVIPSAAGGMVNDGKGGRLVIMHPEEMVLPSGLSRGMQMMVNRTPSVMAGHSFAGERFGGAGRGGGTVNLHVSALDGHSVERVLMANHGAVARAMARAGDHFDPHTPSR